MSGGINKTIDDVIAALNNKADRDLGNTKENWADTVVEYKQFDDGSYYRLWKSGWLEQGGITVASGSSTKTVTFAKAYKDTTYNILFGNGYTGTATATSCMSNTTKSTTGFSLFDSTNASFWTYWKTEGFTDAPVVENTDTENIDSSTEDTGKAYRAWTLQETDISTMGSPIYVAATDGGVPVTGGTYYYTSRKGKMLELIRQLLLVLL